jgi:hypothetical protein
LPVSAFPLAKWGFAKLSQWITTIDWYAGIPCQQNGRFSRLWRRLVATGLGLFHRRTRNLLVNLLGIQDKYEERPQNSGEAPSKPRGFRVKTAPRTLWSIPSFQAGVENTALVQRIATDVQPIAIESLNEDGEVTHPLDPITARGIAHFRFRFSMNSSHASRRRPSPAIGPSAVKSM